MPKILHEENMHAQDFQNPKPKEKEMPSENDTTWKNHHLEDIIKDTSRNEISIDTLKIKIPNSQKRGWFQTNQDLYKVS